MNLWGCASPICMQNMQGGQATCSACAISLPHLVLKSTVLIPNVRACYVMCVSVYLRVTSAVYYTKYNFQAGSECKPVLNHLSALTRLPVHSHWKRAEKGKRVVLKAYCTPLLAWVGLHKHLIKGEI